MIYVSSRMIWRVFFSACLRGIIIWCPQPSHCNRKSIPILSTFQIALPHGCCFFSFNLSPTLISIKILISALLFVQINFVSSNAQIQSMMWKFMFQTIFHNIFYILKSNKCFCNLWKINFLEFADVFVLPSGGRKSARYNIWRYYTISFWYGTLRGMRTICWCICPPFGRTQIGAV